MPRLGQAVRAEGAGGGNSAPRGAAGHLSSHGLVLTPAFSSLQSQVFDSSGPNPMPCPQAGASGCTGGSRETPAFPSSTQSLFPLPINAIFQFKLKKTKVSRSSDYFWPRNLLEKPPAMCWAVLQAGGLFFLRWFVPASALSLCEMKRRHMHKQP